jgi:hypothetical protein
MADSFAILVVPLPRNHPPLHYAPGHVWLQTKPTGVAPSKETRRKRAQQRGEGRRRRTGTASRAGPWSSTLHQLTTNRNRYEKQFGIKKNRNQNQVLKHFGKKNRNQTQVSIHGNNYAHELHGKKANPASRYTM